MDESGAGVVRCVGHGGAGPAAAVGGRGGMHMYVNYVYIALSLYLYLYVAVFLYIAVYFKIFMCISVSESIYT